MYVESLKFEILLYLTFGNKTLSSCTFVMSISYILLSILFIWTILKYLFFLEQLYCKLYVNYNRLWIYFVFDLSRLLSTIIFYVIFNLKKIVGSIFKYRYVNISRCNFEGRPVQHVVIICVSDVMWWSLIIESVLALASSTH